MARQSLFGRLALRLFLLSAFTALSTATKCYYDDGTLAVNDVPCTNGSPSPCCGKEAVCLDNGLCLSITQPLGLSRGSCTEANGWLSDKCPQYCRKKEPSGGSSLVLFNATADEWYYCCDPLVTINGVLSCDSYPGGSPQTPFKIDHGASSSLIPGVALLSRLEKMSNSSSHVTNNTIAPSTQQQHTTSNTTATSSPKDAAIGAGVGIPLGIIALLSTTWALWERRKRQQVIKSVGPQMAGRQNDRYQPTVFSELPGSQPEAVELDESLSHGEGSQSHVGAHSFLTTSKNGSRH